MLGLKLIRIRIDVISHLESMCLLELAQFCRRLDLVSLQTFVVLKEDSQ